MKVWFSIYTDSKLLNGIVYIVTLGVRLGNDAENLALITGIYYILKYIQIESSYFK